MYDHRLDAFIKVAECGSFSKAGAKLFISPMAVIKKINALEANLGLVLFVRGHHGVSLTPAGEVLYQEAKYIIQYSSMAMDYARHACDRGRDVVIRIGTSFNTPCDSLVDIWPSVQEYCPNFKLKLVSFENTREIVDRMFDNMGRTIDAYIGLLDQGMLEQRNCSGLRLKDEPFRIAFPRNHPLAIRKTLHLKDLQGERLMLVRNGKFLNYDRLREYLDGKRLGISFADCESVTVEAFNYCENNNIGIVIISPWKNIHPLFKTIPVSWKFSTPYGIVCAKDPSEQVRQFLFAVEQALALTPEDRFY